MKKFFYSLFFSQLLLCGLVYQLHCMEQVDAIILQDEKGDVFYQMLVMIDPGKMQFTVQLEAPDAFSLDTIKAAIAYNISRLLNKKITPNLVTLFDKYNRIVTSPDDNLGNSAVIESSFKNADLRQAKIMLDGSMLDGRKRKRISNEFDEELRLTSTSWLNRLIHSKTHGDIHAVVTID
jgi:hypothetical protein